MSQVAATMGMTADEANYSNEAYAKLANVAKEMGASTKFSASEAGEALNYLALAGYDADKACAALPTILNLAAAGGMDLAAASDMVTDSMSALGIAATEENLTQFGDQLAKTAQKSNTSVAQLGALLEERTLFCRETVPMILPELEVQDIDNETDWTLAEQKYILLKQLGRL